MHSSLRHPHRELPEGSDRYMKKAMHGQAATVHYQCTVARAEAAVRVVKVTSTIVNAKVPKNHHHHQWMWKWGEEKNRSRQRYLHKQKIGIFLRKFQLCLKYAHIHFLFSISFLSMFLLYFLYSFIFLNNIVAAKLSEHGLELCRKSSHIGVGYEMCKDYGVAGSNLACVCQENLPVCFSSDWKDPEQVQVCDRETYQACTTVCGSSVIAVKCDGRHIDSCIAFRRSRRRGTPV